MDRTPTVMLGLSLAGLIATLVVAVANHVPSRGDGVGRCAPREASAPPPRLDILLALR